jgi:purine-cytosine permease-like protein
MRRRRAEAYVEPLSPKRKWQAITVATLLLVPAYWSLLAGIVSAASDKTDAPATGQSLALGLVVVPFVFIVLAMMSGHPRWPGAVLKAMGLALLIGILVSAIAGDAVTGIVAGVGAGGVVALRRDPDHNWRSRAIGVVVAALYTFVLVRTTSALVLLPAPIFPLTAIGIADHLSERRRERERERLSAAAG